MVRLTRAARGEQISLDGQRVLMGFCLLLMQRGFLLLHMMIKQQRNAKLREC